MAQTIKLSEIASLSVNEIISTLAKAYSTLINTGKSFNSMPSVMLHSQPGIGKSEAVRQIADKIHEQTGKKVNVTDVRLLLFNPTDLHGLPVANADKTFAIWLKPKIFQMDDSKDVVNILFLDEITAAAPSVQASAYQLTLDKAVGEHKLPENCIVICAGNRVTDKSVAFKMPKALANRMMHFEVTTDYQTWKKWAIQHDINPQVLGFLGWKNNYLNTFDPSNDELAFATPRTWAMVSNILNDVDSDIDSVYPLVVGIVGSGVAIELRTWSKIYKNLPNVDNIFKGKEDKIPKDPAVLYALCSSMVYYASHHQDDIEDIACSVEYAKNLPRDFTVMLIQDYLTISPAFERKLLKIPEFTRWISENASYLNA